MSRLPSLPDGAHLGHVYRRFPRGALSIGQYADELLRGESDLTVGEREMLAAYVSGLNFDGFCHGNHKITAEVHEIDTHLLEALFDAISVCALFNFMNRLVEGCGVLFDNADPAATRKSHHSGERSGTPYQDFVRVSTSTGTK